MTDKANDGNQVNPAVRDDDADAAEKGLGEQRESGGNPEQAAGLQNRQSAQNQDQNDRYDPSNGKNHNQMRRNDKRGRMAG